MMQTVPKQESSKAIAYILMVLGVTLQFYELIGYSAIAIAYIKEATVSAPLGL